jgi:hypothetical protein
MGSYPVFSLDWNVRREGKMKLFVCAAAIALAIAARPGVVRASGPASVYALVDKVAFEPSAEKPERVRISGVFITYQSIITARGVADGHYSDPQRGTLYFALGRNEELARREWADLQSVAGTRQVVAFASSFVGNWRVWKPDETPTEPDGYPTGIGVVKVNADQPRAKALLDYKDR